MGVSAGLSKGAGSFISRPTRLLLTRRLRSRLGSGAIFSAARQSVCPSMEMPAGNRQRRAQGIAAQGAAKFQLSARHRPIARRSSLHLKRAAQ